MPLDPDMNRLEIKLDEPPCLHECDSAVSGHVVQGVDGEPRARTRMPDTKHATAGVLPAFFMTSL